MKVLIGEFFNGSMEGVVFLVIFFYEGVLRFGKRVRFLKGRECWFLVRIGYRLLNVFLYYKNFILW